MESTSPKARRTASGGRSRQSGKAGAGNGKHLRRGNILQVPPEAGHGNVPDSQQNGGRILFQQPVRIRQGQMVQFLPEPGGGVCHDGSFQFIGQPQGGGLFRGVQPAEHQDEAVAGLEAQGLGQAGQGTAELVLFRRFRRVKVAMARIPRGVRVRQAHVDMEGGRVIPVFQDIFRQVVRHKCRTCPPAR